MNAQLNDLAFELSDFAGFKLCLCVCDNRASQQGFAKQVLQQLQLRRIRAIELVATVGDLMQQLRLASKKAVAVVEELDLLSDAAFDEQMRRLNFQRDALIALGIPICIWLSNTRLRRLAAVAPDLWSRRTATYQFSGEAIDGLILNLFTGLTEEPETRGEKLTVVRTLSLLIAAEERLQDRPSMERGLDENDPDVAVVLRCLNDLTKSCRQGGTLEVALHLGYLTTLDSTVKDIRARYPSLPFGNIYDAIVGLAPQMNKILVQYRKHFFSRLKSRAKVSLLGYFFSTARGYILSSLKHSSETPEFVDINYPQELGGFGAATTDWSTTAIENARSAQRLEEWLQDEAAADEVSAYFTPDERKALRAIAASTDLKELMKTLNLTKEEALQTRERLKIKVSEYLGLPQNKAAA